MQLPFENEILTEEELQAYYFREHSVARAYLPVRVVEDEHVTEALQLGCGRYLQRVDEVSLQALQRLNALPRTSSFWSNTNRRPTVHKLVAFSAFILQENPRDTDALWTLAVHDTSSGSTGFGQEHWKKLRNLGKLNINWPVVAGLWNAVSLGRGPEALAALLVEIHAVADAVPLVEECAASRSSYVSEWAKGVLRLAARF